MLPAGLRRPGEPRRSGALARDRSKCGPCRSPGAVRDALDRRRQLSRQARSPPRRGRRCGLFPGDEPAEPDFVQAEKWARRAAELQSANGQAVLAFILSAGPEALRNPEEAHRWYERSANGGSPQGDLGYGLSLLRSAIGQQDEEQRAAQHIRRAAEAGLPPAIYWQGALTEHGRGRSAIQRPRLIFIGERPQWAIALRRQTGAAC